MNPYHPPDMNLDPSAGSNSVSGAQTREHRSADSDPDPPSVYSTSRSSHSSDARARDSSLESDARGLRRGEYSFDMEAVETQRVPRRAHEEVLQRLNSIHSRPRRDKLDPFPQRLLRILPRTKSLTSDQDLERFYHITDDIRFPGRDAFSCNDVSRFDEPVFLRIRKKVATQFVVFDTPELEFFRLYRELLILGRVLPPHPNIVQLRDILVSKKMMYIITERCGWRPLEDFFITATNRRAQSVFKELCQTVQFMHRHGVVHNHLNARSIVFLPEGASGIRVKILNMARCSFDPGLATEVRPGFDADEWVDPEERTWASDRRLGQNDVKDLGRLLMAIFVGHHELRIIQPRVKRFDDEAYDLLQLLAPPPLRPLPGGLKVTLDTILAHPWMTQEPKQP